MQDENRQQKKKRISQGHKQATHTYTKNSRNGQQTYKNIFDLINNSKYEPHAV